MNRTIDWSEVTRGICMFHSSYQQSFSSNSLQAGGSGFRIQRVIFQGFFNKFSLKSTQVKSRKIEFLDFQIEFLDFQNQFLGFKIEFLHFLWSFCLWNWIFALFWAKNDTACKITGCFGCFLSLNNRIRP